MLNVVRRLHFRMPRELAVALVIALVHGLLHVFVVPPWSHYDEPAHFEYAALIARHGQFPKADALDIDLRRDLGASMARTGFDAKYGGYGEQVLADGTHIPSIGFSQLIDSPWYYALASLPVTLLPGRLIETQLRTARLVSLALLLVTVLCGWGTAAALTRRGHALRWMLPCALALLPAFVDLMTAVNNDVGGVAAASAVVWAAVWLFNIRREPRTTRQNILGALLLIGLTFISVRMRSTAVVAAAVAAVTLVFTLLNGRLRPLAWSIVAVATIGAVLALFSFDDAALWYRGQGTIQASPTRCDARRCSSIPVGAHALLLSATPNQPNPFVFQFFPGDAVVQMRGQTVTVGAWVWRAAPPPTDAMTATAAIPVISHDYAAIQPKFVTISGTPQFVVSTQTVPTDANIVQLTLTAAPADQTAEVAYDGIVVMPGDFSHADPPMFDDASATSGTWGGKRFVNLVRNASGETTWPALKPEATRLIARYGPDYSDWSESLSGLQDWPGFGWYHEAVLNAMFRTFWTQTGTGNIAVADVWNALARAMTWVGMAGAVAALSRLRKRIDWAVVLALGVMLVLALGTTLLRGTSLAMEFTVWVPVARYAFPAIVPALLLLCVGWIEAFGWLGRLIGMHRWPWLLPVCFTICFLALDAATLAASVSFHYG